MILPTKHLSQDRALLTVGSRVLKCLALNPMTVSALWEHLSKTAPFADRPTPALRYDAYVLTLDLLFSMGEIELQNGMLTRTNP